MPTATENMSKQELPGDRMPSNSISPRGQGSRIGHVEWVVGGVVVASLLACVFLAAQRSTGLTQITVTALDKAAEPRDHNLPIVKKKEALPDYELTLILAGGGKIKLGAKPNTSAADGLTWQVADPVSTADIASVRLREQDMILSDALAEVHVTPESTTANGYRFDFVTQPSFSVGIRSFFGTPIGVAIVVGFGLAVLIIVLRAFRSAFSPFSVFGLS